MTALPCQKGFSRTVTIAIVSKMHSCMHPLLAQEIYDNYPTCRISNTFGYATKCG